MRLFLALSAAVVLATPAFAADPEPIATAPAGASPPTVAEQIDAYLKTSPVLEVDDARGVDGVVPRADGARTDRRPHGEISVGVGTGGYRSVYGRTDLPVGDSGRISLAFENSRYGRAGGPYWGYYGSPMPLDRQRCDLEGLAPERPLDVIGGPNGRCVGRVRGW